MSDNQNQNHDDDTIEELSFNDDLDYDEETGEPLTTAPEDETAHELEILRNESADLKDKLLRTVAEMENIRKRAIKDRDDAQKYGVSNLARELLSVADNLGRAVDAVPKELAQESDAVANLLAGVKATQNQLTAAMEKSGIQMIAAEPGTPFDPNIHEVMFEGESPQHAPGTIIQVMENGYMIHDRLLRPARVGVAKKSAHTQDPKVNVEA